MTGLLMDENSDGIFILALRVKALLDADALNLPLHMSPSDSLVGGFSVTAPVMRTDLCVPSLQSGVKLAPYVRAIAGDPTLGLRNGVV